jgi:hypothetical protein
LIVRQFFGRGTAGVNSQTAEQILDRWHRTRCHSPALLLTTLATGFMWVMLACLNVTPGFASGSAPFDPPVMAG